MKRSLRNQFVFRIFLVSLVTAILSGGVQSYFIHKQITKEVDNQAMMVSSSIQHGIRETNMASQTIEHQIDTKMIAISKHLADRLKGKPVREITNDELIKLSEEFSLAGITIFASNEVGDNIIGVKSTEPQEIGFSFKEFGYLHTHEALLDGKVPEMPDAYVDKNIMVLATAQSGSHTDEPTFFKYAYYHAPGTNYIIDPYIEANEVYQFTQDVGPESWITEVKDSNAYVKEIAVLTPKVFVDPELETKLYPPLKKVVHGSFQNMSNKDVETLKGLADKKEKVTYIESAEGKKTYKMFLPTENDKVIYVAIDYDKMGHLLFRHSIILVVSGFVSIIALFVLTARFFSSIYKNIQVIISQIKQLELGDFTAKSEVIAKGELADLSNSTNHMTDILNGVLKDTTKQAEKVQNLSKELKSEAADSVDKMYALSLDLTSNAREDNFEISDFLDSLEEKLKELPMTEDIENILTRVEAVREISNNRSESTTDMTITLSDLLKSLQAQSEELVDISSTLFKNMYKFKL